MKSENAGPTKIYVVYCRVSSASQGADGLGIAAQQSAVRQFATDGTIVREFVEVESGKRADRPKLTLALAECRRRKATLLIARLDRLSRNVLFIAQLMESGVEFIAADMPTCNRFTVHIMAAVAQQEAEMISKRTKLALAAARARGVKLGGTRKLSKAEKTKGNLVSAAYGLPRRGHGLSTCFR